MCKESTPWKDQETPARSQILRKPHIFFRNGLDPIEVKEKLGQVHHNDTPRPNELDSEDDLDANLTNEGNPGKEDADYEETATYEGQAADCYCTHGRSEEVSQA